MSLYNMLFGMNAAADLLLAILDLTRSDVGRFRDCYAAMEEGEPRIVVHTRNGGGNREHWGDDDVEAGEDCDCTGCVITYRMPTHPNYIRDDDDDFDCTYADVIYS